MLEGEKMEVLVLKHLVSAVSLGTGCKVCSSVGRESIVVSRRQQHFWKLLVALIKYLAVLKLLGSS